MTFNKISHIFIKVVLAWMVCCVISFLSGPTVIFLGSPSWLPLPWSDVGDYVQTNDGKVFVDVQFYNRVLCYDENGKFIASYPYPPGYPKVTGLAVNEEGNVLFRARDDLYIYNSSWELIEKIVGKDDVLRHWRLDENGRPYYMKNNVESPRVADSVAKPGDYLFRSIRGRRVFRCADGSKLVREGHSLKKYSVEGKLTVSYGGPWFLRIFEFPWPAILAWPLFFLLAFVSNRKKTLLKEDKSNVAEKVKKRIVSEVAITVVIAVIALAAIVFGGSLVASAANALPKGNPMGFWLVPIIVIPYWIVVFVAALWTWRSLIGRLDKRDNERSADRFGGCE
ncbi:MAG: hypothetical protein DRP66_03930 [Planctomycetota bacterium]|nr:MAG: hypothetical protein DRP66_03930 [Planctomycetota bacterium]